MNELDELVTLLHNKTLEGKLQWATSGPKQVYVQQGNNIIDVNELLTNASYSVSIRNEDGLVISRQEYWDGNALFEKTKDIFSLARRTALGVDKALADIRQRLKQL